FIALSYRAMCVWPKHQAMACPSSLWIANPRARSPTSPLPVRCSPNLYASSMAKVKGLGRGLDALLGSDEPEAGERLQQLSVGQLRPGKYQPRTHMDPEAIAQLAESIKAQGVLQPILAR